MIQKFVFGLIIIAFSFSSCKKEKVDKSYANLTHEDVESMENSSLSAYETIIYDGVFAGEYNEHEVYLELEDDGDFTINYKDKKVKGTWFKKDDGSMIELDSKKVLPFQFILWSDNTTLMILNSDGTADEEGGNYLTRIEK